MNKPQTLVSFDWAIKHILRDKVKKKAGPK